MKWYIAKIIFKISRADKSVHSQFDEQFRLISAEDLQSATIKAEQIGLTEEETFEDENRIKVFWNYIGIENIFEVDNIKDGVQLYSLTSEQEEPDQYIRYVELRTSALKS